MALAAPSDRLECARCGREVRPRSAQLPRFCPLCGERVGERIVREMSSSGLARSTPPAATAALFLGFAALIPVVGLFLGIWAIVLGLHARKTIAESGGRRGGHAQVSASLALGVLGVLVSLGVGALFVARRLGF